jgi:hypothetical protein
MNVITSLLGLVIVSHLSPKGSGRFTSAQYEMILYLFGAVDPSRPHTIIESGHQQILWGDHRALIATEPSR